MGATFLHDIADALTARLRLAFPETLFQIALMSPVPSMRELEQTVSRPPFLGLAFTGFDANGASRALRGTANWRALLVCENSSSADARYRGDDRGIGMFGMTAAAAALLHGWTIPDVGEVRVIRQDAVDVGEWSANGFALMALDLQVSFLLSPAVSLDDLIRINTTWDLPGPSVGPVDLVTVRTA